jgi:hypothetical protein
MSCTGPVPLTGLSDFFHDLRAMWGFVCRTGHEFMRCYICNFTMTYVSVLINGWGVYLVRILQVFALQRLNTPGWLFQNMSTPGFGRGAGLSLMVIHSPNIQRNSIVSLKRRLLPS